MPARRQGLVRSAPPRLTPAFTLFVIDILYIAGVLALFALLALLARGVERL